MNLKFYNTLILVLIIIVITSCLQSSKRQLPIYNPSDFNPKLVDKSLHNSNENHTVADFKLINQNGKTITQDDYKGKIYVIDFFFTRCKSICPIMTNNMVKIQKAYKNNDDITDNGSGISAALSDTIFLPMVTDKPTGSGLGLPIAQEIVSGHGGIIKSESTASGTTFSTILPLEIE